MSDQATEGLLSGYLRRRRMAAARPFLHGRVLDLGCGSGALAEYIKPDAYVGMEFDVDSLSRARALYPGHVFVPDLADVMGSQFDTVVALAVLEHVEHPLAFLKQARAFLNERPCSALVLTTPAPGFCIIHSAGARLRLFSRTAAAEHHRFISKRELEQFATAAALTCSKYKRFLVGANQLAVLSPVK